ncbi:hypothetical protein LSH36_118g07015 [Paralvinella palmiformis]|uniref:Gamma-butyrobetaine hydroxylase-like N-terminal domain-containing protein n=1 Tax=Paralvinella palmiformis TaxID=53620 RepID=A0AAD9NBQ0_9ANNE|nr:hypothetical protein LSH36_118g07015 [Paralvinella palmiformis]
MSWEVKDNGKMLLLHHHHTGKTQRFHSSWLRHNCRCNQCVESDSGQRMIEPSELEPQYTIKHVQVSDDEANDVILSWHEEDHISKIPHSYLEKHGYSEEERTQMYANRLPSVSKSAIGYRFISGFIKLSIGDGSGRDGPTRGIPIFPVSALAAPTIWDRSDPPRTRARSVGRREASDGIVGDVRPSRGVAASEIVTRPFVSSRIKLNQPTSQMARRLGRLRPVVRSQVTSRRAPRRREGRCTEFGTNGREGRERGARHPNDRYRTSDRPERCRGVGNI